MFNITQLINNYVNVTMVTGDCRGNTISVAFCNNHTQYVTVYTTNGEHVGNIDKECVNKSILIHFRGIACDTGYLYVCCEFFYCNSLIHVFLNSICHDLLILEEGIR